MNIKEIKEELLTQDNMATADPYWVIRDYRNVVTPEDVGNVKGHKYFDHDNCSDYTEEELKEHFKDNKVKFTESDFDEIAEFRGFEKYYYTLIEIDEEVFLTKKEAEEYFNSRRYAFSKEAHLYCKSAYRSEELKFIMQGIKNGTIVEINK
jgi:hypothetical protein